MDHPQKNLRLLTEYAEILAKPDFDSRQTRHSKKTRPYRELSQIFLITESTFRMSYFLQV